MGKLIAVSINRQSRILEENHRLVWYTVYKELNVGSIINANPHDFKENKSNKNFK